MIMIRKAGESASVCSFLQKSDKKQTDDMSLSSFLRKSRILIAGDYREIERNLIDAANRKVIKRYRGKQDIYCILRLYSDEAGLFNYFLKGLAGISYCCQHGYIPVIDMQTKENIFFSTKERREKNAWECFFMQPAGVSFEEVKKKKNCIVIENIRMPEGNLLRLEQQEQQTAYWRKVCKKYLHFSDAVEAETRRYEAAFSEKKKWLGVLARGTDYLSIGVGHAVQPDMETLIEKIRSVKEQYCCDGIFLATEDSEILDELAKAFPGEIMSLEQKRYRGKQEEKLGQKADYKQDAITMNTTYLAAIRFLARCNCFIAADTGGATGAYLMSEGYEYMHLWVLGTMGSTDSGSLDISKV